MWNACINHEIKQCKTIITQWHFATALIVLYYQLQFVIVHSVWHWQVTRHALNIKKMWDWWFDCQYRLSKLVEIQMINRISKQITPPAGTHTPWVPPDLLDPTGATYDDACVILGHSPRPVDIDSQLVTNWAAERSFTSVNMLMHTGERLFSCSVCDYQCRRDCDLKRHMRRHKSPHRIQ